MAGRIKAMLDSIIEQRGQGNPTIVSLTKTKLLLKGINVDNYTKMSDDDPVMMEKVKQAAVEWNVRV